MKNLKSPLIIQLNELPEEGQSFEFSRQSGELNSELSDIIGNNDYKISFHIRPIGNAYEMIGKFSTNMDLICSRCAIDFNKNISESFKEIILVNSPLPRKAQTSKTNHSSEWVREELFCNQLESESFNVAKFTHEIIALAEPIQPLGKDSCDNSCENYIKAINEGWLQDPVTRESSQKENNPFAILQQLKPS